MTFEEWKEKHSFLIENVAFTFFNYERGVDTKTCYDELEYLLKRAFNAGRPQWHDLRKDPNDLPKKDESSTSITVLNQDQEKVYYDYDIEYWRYDDEELHITKPPIAWCEIPKYTEE